MSNRFYTPSEQFADSAGAPLSGAQLFFYITGTSTKSPTYSEPTLMTANTNPVVLDSAGRAGNIFLDPAVTYKVVLAPATDTDPPTSPIFTADPVVDPAANVVAAFQIYNGNPNGNVAGSQGSVGGSGASVVWDVTDQLLYVCTVSGTTTTAVWVQVGATLAGAVTFTGTITPSVLTTTVNDYAPAGFATASVLRLSSTSAVGINGIAGGTGGRLIILQNIGTFAITLFRQNASSSAANRFLFEADYVIQPNQSIALEYDTSSAMWRTMAAAANAPVPAGWLVGLTLSRPTTTTFGVATGVAANEDGGIAYTMTLASALTKSTSAWAVGTGNGGLDTGAVANTTWYHVHLIRKDADGSIDALYSLSVAAPTMPAGYTARRRLGALLTDGSAHFILFSQNGDEFLWDAAVADVDATNPGTSAVTRTLTVPTGVKVKALTNAGFYLGSAASNAMTLSSLDVSDQVVQTDSTSALTLPADVAGSPSAARWHMAPVSVRTNTSAAVRSRLNTSGASDHIGIITRGWIDTRGRI